MPELYKIWRATTEPSLHVLCFDGLQAYDDLPDRVRRMGPWQGSRTGSLDRLRPHYRALVAEQGFVILYRRQDLLRLET